MALPPKETYTLTIYWPDSAPTEEEFHTLQEAKTRIAKVASMPWIVPAPSTDLIDGEGNEILLEE